MTKTWGRVTKYLLDTNVVSEMTKSEPNPSVLAFLNESADLWLASKVVHVLEFGLRLTPPGPPPRSLVPFPRELRGPHPTV